MKPSDSSTLTTAAATNDALSVRRLLTPSIFEAVALRCRPHGLFLAAIDNDGMVALADTAACEFFVRYGLPLVQEMAANRLLPRPSDLPRGLTSPIELAIPGLRAICVPWVARRQLVGWLLVASRAATSGDDVRAACERLKLDAGWIGEQAASIVPIDAAALGVHARMATSMLHDQIRVSALEKELKSLSEQLGHSYEELDLVYQVSGANQVSRKPEEFFERACLDMMAILRTNGVGFALIAQGSIEAQEKAWGQPDLGADDLRRLSEEVLRYLAGHPGPLLIDDLGLEAQYQWMTGRATQLMAVPLRRQGKLLGCFWALDKQEGNFDSVDGKLLDAIANESAIYLENARLFDDVRDLVMGLMHSLTSAVDAKDTYTYGHSERVALLSRHLARALELPDDEVERIYMSALLHDVGKIGVPEAVLQKAGQLTAEEFEQIKRHPDVGARILQDVKQIHPIVPGVLHHHERFDGTGYPSKLSGANISLMGRIICLADSFDAMTSSRTYRAARPIEVALCEILRCAGTHFDPVLVDAFLRTSADGYRELLSDHQAKSRRLLKTRAVLRAA